MNADSDDTQVYAGLGIRIVAHLLDILIVAVLITLIIALGSVFQPTEAATQGIAVIGLLLYFIYFEGANGQTPGKRVFDIAVVKEDGSPMDMKASVIRNLFRIIDSLFTYLVGVVAILLSDRDQRIGDMMADTVVVEQDN